MGLSLKFDYKLDTDLIGGKITTRKYYDRHINKNKLKNINKR